MKLGFRGEEAGCRFCFPKNEARPSDQDERPRSRRPKSTQAGWRIPGPGPGCGLGAGSACARLGRGPVVLLDRVPVLAGPKERRTKKRGSCALLGRWLCWALREHSARAGSGRNGHSHSKLGNFVFPFPRNNFGSFFLHEFKVTFDAILCTFLSNDNMFKI